MSYSGPSANTGHTTPVSHLGLSPQPTEIGQSGRMDLSREPTQSGQLISRVCSCGDRPLCSVLMQSGGPASRRGQMVRPLWIVFWS